MAIVGPFAFSMDTDEIEVLLFDNELVATGIRQFLDDIGLTESERAERSARFAQQLADRRQDFLAETTARIASVTVEIESIRQEFTQKLQAVGASSAEIQLIAESFAIGPLLDRRQEARFRFESFMKKTYDRRCSEFVDCQTRIRDLSFNLGFELDDAFAEIGDTDLSVARLERFKAKVDALEAELSGRIRRFEALKTEILALSEELADAVPPSISELFENPGYGDVSMQLIEAQLKCFEDLREHRRAAVAELAVQITRLWDLLEVDEAARREFLDSRASLSEENVAAYARAVEEMTERRNQMLPELIERMKGKISQICEELTFDQSKVAEICERAEDDCDDAAVLANYDAELAKLQRERSIKAPIIELINRRDAIVNDHAALADAPGPDSSDRLHTEKVLRRCKIVLPKVNRKLKALLLNFQTDNGEDFIWKGRRWIDELADVQVSPAQLWLEKYGTRQRATDRSQVGKSAAPAKTVAAGQRRPRSARL
jgi:hypothetical protein